MVATPNSAQEPLAGLPPPAEPRWKIMLAAAAIVCGGALAYSNSFRGPFVFDDLPGLMENGSIQGEWWEAFTPPNGGQTVTGRPLVNLSLAVNYHLGGFNVVGYHLLNLVIHLLAGLALFGFIRRTLLLPSLRKKYGPAAVPLALAAALLWTLHPLQTESVTYVIQRAEAMMGLFYFLTFYCFVRGAAAGARWWLLLSVFSCILGVLCKEVTITAPVLLLLFDLIFVADSRTEPFRRRRWYYGGLACAMVLQLWLAFGVGNRGGSAGFGAGVAWWDYALSQFPAIAQYLVLAVWPSAQTLDYGTALAGNMRAVLPAQILVMAIVAGTLWALARRPQLGFLGAWFFVALAPSSSVVPITTETVAEHRMYVSLAALAVLAAIGLRSLCGRRALLAACVLALAFGGLTFARNRDYRSAPAIWADAVAKNPDIPRPHNNYGIALVGVRRLPESVQAHRTALQLNPRYPDCETNLGSALMELGQREEALLHFQKAAREMPMLTQIHYSLGNAYRVLGRADEAIAAYGNALKVMPGYAPARGNLMGVYNETGQFEKSIALGKIGIVLDPQFFSTRNNLANAYIRSNQPARALEQYAYIVTHIDAAAPTTYWGIGNCLMLQNQIQDAVAWYRVGLTWNPQDPMIHNNLGTALSRLGLTAEAIDEYAQAVRIAPNFSDARQNLQNSLQALQSPSAPFRQN